MTSGDYPSDPKHPAAPADLTRIPHTSANLFGRTGSEAWLVGNVVRDIAASVDERLRPFAAAHSMPARHGVRLVLSSTGPVTTADAHALAALIALSCASNPDLRALYVPRPLVHGHVLATYRIVWDTWSDWHNDATGEHTSAVCLTTLLDGSYPPAMGGLDKSKSIQTRQHAGEIARDDLASMHFHRACLPKETQARIQHILHNSSLPDLTKTGITAGEMQLQEHILGNKGPHPTIGLGADHATVFAVLTRAQDYYGRLVLRSILADYLAVLEGAPIGAQSGLKPSTAAERHALGMRIPDGASFTHALSRLLSRFEMSVICTKCRNPAFVDWFRDRFRFRHSALRGGKPSIHGSASILPKLHLTETSNPERD